MRKTLLSIFTLVAMNTIAQDCSDLFISEYVEGSGNNKALEIYNPTTTSIALNGYKIERYSNGATTNTTGGVLNLSGSIAPNSAFVIVNGQTTSTGTSPAPDPILQALADQLDGVYPAPTYMNGNDAIVLTKNSAIIDVIGKVGEDPSSGAWTADSASGFQTGSWWTRDHTLIRKANVKKGDGNGLDLFNPSLEWDSLAEDSWNNLGSHICDCASSTAITENNEVSYVMYPNPANQGNIVSINTNTNIERIDVVNILGEKVLTQESNKINTSNLARGTYLINIRFTDGRTVNNKLVIE